MEIKCPHCGNDDKKLITITPGKPYLFCEVCAKQWKPA